MNKDLIYDKLYERLLSEYNTFLDELKKLPPEKIIEKSYEKVFKEDILLCFEFKDIDFEKVKVFYDNNVSLDGLYSDWLGTDYSYMDILRDSIDDSAESWIEDMKRNGKGISR